LKIDLIFIFLSTIIVGALSLNECPPAEDLYPCKCDLKRKFWNIYNGGIFCGGEEMFDMKKIFHRLSGNKKYVDSPYGVFVFNNTKIVEIPEDVFGNFTFNAIFFADPSSDQGIRSCCNNLEKINYKAFSSSSKITTQLLLMTIKLKTWEIPYSLIDLFNQFEKLTEISCDSPINLIDRSFGKGLSNLRRFELVVDSIKGSPFFELNHLQTLLLEGRSYGDLDHIPWNAFRFNNRTNEEGFTLALTGHKRLNGSSFEIGSLVNINTNVTINMNGNTNISFLEEKVFAPFTEINVRNKINFQDILDCSDCRNYWVIKKKDLLKERINAYCEHGTIWENEDNFKRNCGRL